MYEKILHNPLAFGDGIGASARSILTGLLTRDPTQRLGVNGADEIKKHSFFKDNIDFKKLYQKKIQPPFKPSVASPVVRIADAPKTVMGHTDCVSSSPHRMFPISTPSLRLRSLLTV